MTDLTIDGLIETVKSMKASCWLQGEYEQDGKFCIAGFLGKNIEPESRINGVVRLTYFLESLDGDIGRIFKLNDYSPSFKKAQKSVIEYLEGLNPE